MDSKGPDAFRTISEVAGDLDLPQHVLRFWETRFSQIKPMKRGGGRRYYRPDDVDLLRGIRHLLYDEGYTIKGVQRILKERGVRFVSDAVDGQGDPEGHSTSLASDNLATHGEPAANLAQRTPDTSPANGHRQTPGTAETEKMPMRDGAPSKATSQPAGTQSTGNLDSTSRDAGSQSDARSRATGTLAGTEANPAFVEDAANVPRDILLDDQPARKNDSRSIIDKIRGVPETEAPENSAPGQLSRDDIRRLQSTLFELLECKRILDRSRSG